MPCIFAHMAKRHSISKLLQELEKEDLIAEIEKLCDRFNEVKKYFEIELSGDTTRYVAAAKKDIERQFRLSNGNWRKKPKASKLNTIIKDFERISIYKEDIIELLLYRIEQTIEFDKHRELSFALLQSTAVAFRRVAGLISAEGMEEKYAARLAAIKPVYRGELI